MSEQQQESRELVVAKQVAGALAKMEPEYRAVLPAHITPQAFIRIAQTAIQVNPDLQQCTPRSLIAACTRLAEIGLQPDGVHAALVAYNVKAKRRGQPDSWEKQAKPMPMVAGIRDLVRRSGEVKDWKVRIVREGDYFEHIDGDEERLVHKPSYDLEQPITHVYSIAYLDNGELSRHVMPIAAVERIRMRSKQADTGPWVSDYDEMVKKTCLRQHSKALPKAKDDIQRERITGSMQAIDEAEGVIEQRGGLQVVAPAVSMHEQARARLHNAVETSAFHDDDGHGETPAQRQAETPAPAEPARATRKRRTAAERVADNLAAAEAKQPPAAQGNGHAGAAAQQTASASSRPASAAPSSRSASTAPAAAPSRDLQEEFDDIAQSGRDPESERQHAQSQMDQASFDDDRFPGDPDPDEREGEDPEELAYRDGWHAADKGMLRVPPRGMTNAQLVEYWLMGHDSYTKSNPKGRPSADESEKQLDQMVGRVFC